MIIFIIGHTCSGKTTFVDFLSQYDNTIDLDRYIEAQEKLSIPEIIESEGWIPFRSKEHFYLRKLSFDNKNAVVAVGGGCPCYADNMQFMNEIGLTIYIQSDIEEIIERIKKENRPMFIGKTDSEIRKILIGRETFYNKSKIKI